MAEQSSISVDYETEASRIERQTNVMTITELEGKKRVITLSTSSMPKRGVAWGMEQRIATRRPAGAPEATQQLLGPKQQDTQMQGIWRRTWLGRNPVLVVENGREIRVVYPATMRDLFYDILIQGSLLQVTWKSVTRMGRLKLFNAPHDRDTDIAWDATFEWINSGTLFPYRLVSTRDQGVKSEVQGLILISETLVELEATEIPVDLRTPRPKGTPTLTVGQVSAFLDSPKNLIDGVGRNLRELTNKLKSVADLATKFKNMPAEINASILATAENIVATCNQFHDEFTRVSPEQTTYDRRVASLVQTASYYSTGTKQTEYMAQTADQLREKAKRRKAGGKVLNSQYPTQGDLLALHIVKQGDTLAGISARYYGTPDHALDIAKVNGLTYPVAPVSTATGKPTMGGKSILSIPRV